MKRNAPHANFETAAHGFLAPSRGEIAKPASLSEAIQRAVRKIDDGLLHFDSASGASLASQPRVMLALLAYFYANQQYASREIEKSISSDNAFRKMCQDQLPTAAALKRFREANKHVLQRCLAGGLLYLAERKVEAGIFTRANELLIAKEAARRITIAAFVDSAELSDGSSVRES